MDFIFITIILCVALSLRCSVPDEEDCMCKEKTAQINGVFTAIIFLDHFSQYIDESTAGILHPLWLRFFSSVLVIPFLFYSGYGVMMSLRKNGETYIRSFPRNRIFPTYLHFVCAVLLYMLLNIILGSPYSVGQNILALVGWDNIGNSNWYIFSILALYIGFYISCCFFKGKWWRMCLCMSILISAYAILMHFAGKEGLYYNTAPAFLCGMIYAHYKTQIENFLQRKSIYFLAAAATILALIFVLNRNPSGLEYHIIRIASLAGLLLFCQRLNIRGIVWMWLGSHVFEVYILQRIPMILFKGVFNNIYVYFLICACITYILTNFFVILEHKVDSIFLHRR